MPEVKPALHIYPSTLLYESRILKMAHTQAAAHTNAPIYICGVHGEGLPQWEDVSDKIILHRIRLRWPRVIPGLKSLVYYLELYHRIFWCYTRVKPSVVQCHSLSMLWVCVLLKLRLNCTLIYDAHELETERLGLNGWRKHWAKFTERTCMKYVDHILVVSPSIEIWYKQQYPHKPVTCIINVPYALDLHTVDKDYFRKQFNIPADKLICIYAGVLNIARSIPALLRVFSVFASHSDKHIVFMGYGIYEKEIKEFADKYPNIHYHPPVNPTDVSRYCAAVDVGIVLSENVCLSYYYGYANKMFEYVQGGCAVLASDFPDMGSFVQRHNCGWAINPNARAIETWLLTLDMEVVQKAKEASRTIRQGYTWENEQQKYVDVLKKV